MKRNIIVDERVENERRKINSGALQLIMVFLLCSILVKQFVLKEGFSSYAVEFIAFYGGVFYILIRNVFLGNIVNEALIEKKNKIITAFTVALTITIINGFTLGFSEGAIFIDKFLNLLMSFTTGFITAYVALVIIEKLTKKKAEKISRELEDEEI